ncbi:MAG TPA: 50S ribosomal protein L11 methyltransferase, partial [bacterium]
RGSGIGDWEKRIGNWESKMKKRNSGRQPQSLNPEPRRFDLVLANIDRSTLIRWVPRMSACIKPGGKWILSGMLAVEKKTIEDALALAGWKNLETKLRGEWAGLVCALEEYQ